MNRYRYIPPKGYSSITYTVGNTSGGTVDLTQFLNDLHTIQLDCIDEALEKSDLSDAKAVIDYIKGKL